MSFELNNRWKWEIWKISKESPFFPSFPPNCSLINLHATVASQNINLSVKKIVKSSDKKYDTCLAYKKPKNSLNRLSKKITKKRQWTEFSQCIFKVIHATDSPRLFFLSLTLTLSLFVYRKNLKFKHISNILSTRPDNNLWSIWIFYIKFMRYFLLES